MRRPLIIQIFAIIPILFSSSAWSEEAVPPTAKSSTAPASASTPALAPASSTTIYRQVLPDGRVIYSDKVVRDVKVDEVITIAPPIQGNLWTTEARSRPAVQAQGDSTQIKKTATPPGANKKKTLDEATDDVIRAEMFLEDAKKRQEQGIEPLPGERTGNFDGKSRLNEIYQHRQKLLAKDVAYAEATLKKAIRERNALLRY